MDTQGRKIEGAVLQSGRIYTAGNEDALAKVLPATDVARLIDKGVLLGDWSGDTASDVPAPAQTSHEPELAHGEPAIAPPDVPLPSISGDEPNVPGVSAEPNAGTGTAGVPTVTRKELSRLSFPKLRAFAKQSGVKAKGTRKALEAAVAAKLEHTTTGDK